MASPVRATRGKAAGFTLVEMMVALALSGLVAVLLLDGTRLAAVGLDRLSRHTDSLDARRSLVAVLQRTLESVRALPLDGDAATFIGLPTRLSFVTLSEDGGPGLYRVALDFAAARADRPLLLTRRRADPFVLPLFHETVLALHLRGVAFAYFGAKDPTAKPAWHRSWQSVPFPPRLVRLTIDDGSAALLPIVVRLWAAPGAFPVAPAGTFPTASSDAFPAATPGALPASLPSTAAPIPAGTFPGSNSPGSGSPGSTLPGMSSPGMSSPGMSSPGTNFPGVPFSASPG